MRSPTGSNEIRMDSMGSGVYGAPRGHRKHRGTDYIVIPGAAVVAPISGEITRIAIPYVGQEYSGLVITSKAMTVKLFYFKPLSEIVGNTIREGMVIGFAQDVSKMYGEDMLPHIHLQIDRISQNPADWINL
jgi:hypothetical protein